MLNIQKTPTLTPKGTPQYELSPQTKIKKTYYISNDKQQNTYAQQAISKTNKQIINTIKNTNRSIQANEIKINNLQIIKKIISQALHLEALKHKDNNDANDVIANIKTKLKETQTSQDSNANRQQKEILYNLIKKLDVMNKDEGKEKEEEILTQLTKSIQELLPLNDIKTDDNSNKLQTSIVQIDKQINLLQEQNIKLKDTIKIIQIDDKLQQYSNDEVSKLELKDVFNASLDKNFFKSVQNLLDPLHG